MKFVKITDFIYFQEIIPHGPGMSIHIINLIVLVLIPMVAIHIKGAAFSLSKLSMILAMCCIVLSYNYLCIFQWVLQQYVSYIQLCF